MTGVLIGHVNRVCSMKHITTAAPVTFGLFERQQEMKFDLTIAILNEIRRSTYVTFLRSEAALPSTPALKPTSWLEEGP